MKCEEEMEYKCVECGFEIKTLFVQYSPGNIRLMKCIILIDLVLHKQKAYRHLLYNALNQETMNLEGLLWKSTMAFILLDAYRSLLLQRNEEQQGSSLSYSLLVSRSQKVSMDVFVGNLIFFCILLLAMRILLNKSVEISRCRNLFGAIVVSSYFKIFFIAMMVWEFPSSVIFIIDLFVFSSNTVALRVITECDLKRCIAACFTAHATKLLVTQLPMLLSTCCG
ncbi:protein ARV 1-like isoform X2 [Euphorbia lathyris]|uniref:protein ARV 1-like isoform X2 n=1 Tax=Euphorbia lathyris TaxID=212925 RepID=UPI00331333EB